MSKAMVLNEMWARCPPSVMKSQLDNTAIFMNQAQAIRTLGELNLVTISSLVIFVNLANHSRASILSSALGGFLCLLYSYSTSAFTPSPNPSLHLYFLL